MKKQTLKVHSHLVPVTNLDKVLWPKLAYTKRDLIAYYRAVAPVLLPYLANRPLSLKRFPNGVDAPGFFQKDFSGGSVEPSWVKTVPLPAPSVGKTITYLVCQNEATLVYLANLGCIELHPWHSRLRTLNKPDYIVLDLDPTGVAFEVVVTVAKAIHGLLTSLTLQSFCKTSGKRGLHIYIPLPPRYRYEQASSFARGLVHVIHRQLPEYTSLERNPGARQRKVYLDWLQNRRGQTIIAPYCLRPTPPATVATPLGWEEVNDTLDPTVFTMATATSRLQAKRDPWRTFWTTHNTLTAAEQKLRAYAET